MIMTCPMWLFPASRGNGIPAGYIHVGNGVLDGPSSPPKWKTIMDETSLRCGEGNAGGGTLGRDIY